MFTTFCKKKENAKFDLMDPCKYTLEENYFLNFHRNHHEAWGWMAMCSVRPPLIQGDFLLWKGKSSMGLEGIEGFPGGTVVENLPANAGDTGSSPGLGGSHMPRSS